MNPAQALLREVLRDDYACLALNPDLREAIREEPERADTTPPKGMTIPDRTDAADLTTRLAPTAAQLAAQTTQSFDETLEALMRAAGFVPAREVWWDRVVRIAEGQAVIRDAVYRPSRRDLGEPGQVVTFADLASQVADGHVTAAVSDDGHAAVLRAARLNAEIDTAVREPDRGPRDSPRWCATCAAYGDHHTDRHGA
jgi:hypothetical protein